MHHFFTAPDLVADGRVRLVGEEAHHAARVLRVKPGERISVADGTGRVLDAVVTGAEPEAVDARVILTRSEHPPTPALVLYQGIPKKERMEFVVEKAVELGAREIRPFLAERSVVRWDERKASKVVERWRAIARAAAKQCRSPWITDVMDIAAGTRDVASDPGFLLVLDAEAGAGLRDALPAAPPQRLSVVVGPEGGLAPAEIDVLREAGGHVVTLGERILRSDTAGPVALALVNYTYGNIG